MMDKLYIIIPAYNEEENIDAVAREWHEIVSTIGEGSKLVIIDDGSKDSTYDRLKELKKELPYLEPITKKNSGHGGTILFGYQYALENKADYIFQTDSDGQTLPTEFGQLWDKRKKYDVQIGHRKGRQDGFSRVFVTKVLKFVLYIMFHKWITDANTPFRLMKADILERYIRKVPEDYNLSNVFLTVLFEKNDVNVHYIPITFRPRQGGVNSINIRKISQIGLQAIKDFKTLRKRI